MSADASVPTLKSSLLALHHLLCPLPLRLPFSHQNLPVQAPHLADVKAHDFNYMGLLRAQSSPIASLPYSLLPLTSHCHQWQWWGLFFLLWGIRTLLESFASIPKPHSASFSNINSLGFQKVEPMPHR